MYQSDSGVETLSEDESCYFDFDEDEIFEENIDEFDQAMDKDYDDGIAHSELDDSYDEDLSDDHDQEDFQDREIPVTESPDELEDYDELED